MNRGFCFLEVEILMRIDHKLPKEIKFVRINGVNDDFSRDGRLYIDDINTRALDIACYQLTKASDITSLSALLVDVCKKTAHEDLPQIPVRCLPHEALDGSWERLVYKPRVHQNILEGLIRLGGLEMSPIILWLEQVVDISMKCDTAELPQICSLSGIRRQP